MSRFLELVPPVTPEAIQEAVADLTDLLEDL